MKAASAQTPCFPLCQRGIEGVFRELPHMPLNDHFTTWR